MALVINSNIQSLSSQNNLAKAQSSQSEAMDRLSSGKRINSAADDAAGLSISTKMTSQIKGLNQAMRNANDGVSMIQTAEGALDQSQNILQRMRELAVQSSNGTYQDGNRDTMNAEVEQLKAELDRIGESTSFNGIDLLSGEQGSVSIQVGDQAGQSIDVNLATVSTDSLGVSAAGGVSAQGTDNAITAGDLKINGVDINASLASDDTASTANAETSAIAKAAAINKHSAETGVTAQANENVVNGAAMTANAGDDGDVVINGITVAAGFTTAVDNTQTRAALVEKINEQSELTGVTAEDTGDDTQGIKLTATDGRNITVDITGGAGNLTSANTGLTSGTFEAGFTLVADAGTKEIKIEGGDGSVTGQNLSDVGLTEGTYTAGEVSVAGTQTTTAAAAAPTNVLDEGDMVINGVTIAAAKASDDKASIQTAAGNSGDKAASGIALAAAINKSAEFTGVTATVNETVATGNTTGATNVAGKSLDLTINGQSVTLTVGATAEESRANAVDQINSMSEKTGVIAEDNGTSLTLTAADGRNITAAADNTGAALLADFGLNGAAGVNAGAVTDAHMITTSSNVTLNSASEITVDAGSNGNAALEQLGFRAGSYGNGADGQYIKDIDISTVDGATKAIDAIDNALDQVSAARSEFGAVQNRLDFTVDNLSNTVENTTAARSRIEDTDYAAESANLSRAQVLQQASQTMLAQANSAPQQVLSLLQ